MPYYPIEKQVEHIETGLNGQNAVWQKVLETKGEPFSFRDIYENMNCTRDVVKICLRDLVDLGYLEVIGTSQRPKCNYGFKYKLVKTADQRPVKSTLDNKEKPKSYMGRDQMWRSMKMLSIFTSVDLSIAASTNFKKVSHGYAKNYIRALLKAGYLKIINKPNASQGINPVYRLLPGKNTGPLSPIVKRNLSVFDPNLKQIVWEKESGGEQ